MVFTVIGDDKKRSNISRPNAVKELQVSTLSSEIPDPLTKFKDSIRPAEPGVYGEVYINPIAAKAVKQSGFLFTDVENKNAPVGDRTAKNAFRFPTGSIIVREKVVAREKTTVESLAVMIKRESRFNPQADGWQFLYLDPKTLAITKNDQATCLSCHQLKKETNFVFNSYRP